MAIGIEDRINQFIHALALAGIQLDKTKITIDDLGCPHKPNGLPKGKMAVYLFEKGNDFLKIGKAGPNSDARFRSQHYSPYRAQSNLASSLLNDPDAATNSLDESNIDDWIKTNVRRIDILLDADVGIFILNFLEAFLHCALNPKYEGFGSQRH